MTYLITNQNNFGHIAYPCTSYPKATVKSGGCGACSMLMVVENLTSERQTMASWIRWVLATGARVNGGTDMRVLCKAVSDKYGLEYTTTNSETALKEHIANGGMAIANVGGKRSGWAGLFSSSGHYITVLGLLSDGRFIIGDPGLYSGKFNSSFRRSRVQVDGSLVYVNADNLHKDTLNRTPNYYLLKIPALQSGTATEEEEEMIYKDITEVPEWYKPAVQRRIDLGVFDGKNITETMCRIWTVEDRQRYRTLEDIPVGEFQDVISNLIHKGYIRGDGNGVLDLSQDMVRNYVINYRAGLYT